MAGKASDPKYTIPLIPEVLFPEKGKEEDPRGGELSDPANIEKWLLNELVTERTSHMGIMRHVVAVVRIAVAIISL